MDRNTDDNISCYRTVYGNIRCYNSGWYNWGRWVLLGIIIFFFLVTLFCLSWYVDAFSAQLTRDYN